MTASFVKESAADSANASGTQALNTPQGLSNRGRKVEIVE